MIPYPVAKGWKTLIDFTARDNPKVDDIKVDEVLDDSIIRELDDSGFISEGSRRASRFFTSGSE